jgi:hypothetical protein
MLIREHERSPLKTQAKMDDNIIIDLEGMRVWTGFNWLRIKASGGSM